MFESQPQAGVAHEAMGESFNNLIPKYHHLLYIMCIL